MDPRFEAFIAAAVQQAKAAESLIWADQVAERIVSSTPLSVHVADISAQIAHEAARMGVAVTVAAKGLRSKIEACGCAA
jgi:hypothetical protein